MRLFEDVYLVGSGQVGLSNRWDCHIYLIDGGEELALIDAGVGLEPERILENISADGFSASKIRQVFITHSHSDHAVGASALRERLGCQILASEIEARLMGQKNETIETGLRLAKSGGIYPPDYQYLYTNVDATLTDGQLLTVGKYSLRAIQVPGHSPGALCFLLEQPDRRVLFTSDVVLANGTIMFFNCPGCDLAEYRENIGKLSGLGIDALLPGHALFTVTNGQESIDQAIEKLQSLYVGPLLQM